MGYRLPCGPNDRGPTGVQFPITDLDECLSKMKRQGGSSRKYKKSKRVFRKKSRSTRRR